MKVKRTTYGEFNKRFSGFNRLGFDKDEVNISTNGCLSIIYRAVILYSKKKDCTLVALTCLGYFDLFGARKDDPTYVLKLDGKVKKEDLIDKEFKYRDEISVITEQLYKEWHESLEEES